LIDEDPALTDRISLVGDIAEGISISRVSGASERLVEGGIRVYRGGGERKLNTELVGIQGVSSASWPGSVTYSQKGPWEMVVTKVT
jgi:hypothetical protein